jgi:hypothetical protein
MVEDYKRSGYGGDVDGDISVKDWKESIEHDLGELDDMDGRAKEEFIVEAKFKVKFVISHFI